MIMTFLTNRQHQLCEKRKKIVIIMQRVCLQRSSSGRVKIHDHPMTPIHESAFYNGVIYQGKTHISKSVICISFIYVL